MKKALLIITALALLAAGCGQNQPYPKKKGVLRIVQYNVGAFSKELDNSIPMIASMMNELKADAISLNELDSCNLRHGNYQLADFASVMGGWNYRFGRAMPYKQGAYGVGVAVGDEILDGFTVTLPKEDGSEQRACCVVETPRFVMASTHLDHKSRAAALLQAKTLTDAIKARYGDSSKPVFLAGDMNVLPDSEVIAQFKEDWTLLSGSALTFPAKEPRKCIDYIFVLNNAAKVKSLDTCVPEEFHSGDVKTASDHRPVYVDIQID